MESGVLGFGLGVLVGISFPIAVVGIICHLLLTWCTRTFGNNFYNIIIGAIDVLLNFIKQMNRIQHK